MADLIDVPLAKNSMWGEKSVVNMADGLEQVRFAVTVFDRPASLGSTILALLEEGVKLEQLCLVALASTMKRISRLGRSAKSEWPRLSALTDHLVDWPGTGISRRIVATSNPLVATLPHVLDANNIIKSQIHSPADDGHVFSEHIQNGAIALIVGAATPAQQASNTRILLAQSTHGVKTYEFSMPEASGK